MNARHLIFLTIGTLGLVGVYLFQSYLDLYTLLWEWRAPRVLDYTSDYKVDNYLAFTVNKVFRYLLNDLCAIAIIYALFKEKKYVRFSFYVMTFGLLILLPLYLGLYFYQPKGFSSMISHLHRIVLNPVLMMLLIPAFYYQKTRTVKDDTEN